MVLTFEINDAFVSNITEETGTTNFTRITEEALILYKWCITEARNGRVLLTANKKTEDIKEVRMPLLERGRKLAEL